LEYTNRGTDLARNLWCQSLRSQEAKLKVAVNANTGEFIRVEK